LIDAEEPILKEPGLRTKKEIRTKVDTKMLITGSTLQEED